MSTRKKFEVSFREKINDHNVLSLPVFNILYILIIIRIIIFITVINIIFAIIFPVQDDYTLQLLVDNIMT